MQGEGLPRVLFTTEERILTDVVVEAVLVCDAAYIVSACIPIDITAGQRTCAPL
jgi:hypothetical protein